ncbi:MAG TPA: serine hydrolase domain-containing protein [Candidatus Limnocylindrales bacterium]
MPDDDATIDLGPMLAEFNRDYRRPGLVGGLTDQHRLRAVGATGVRRIDRAAPVTTADPFHIGSITKAMSATVIAALIEQGRLEWTTTAAEVFPDAAGQMHPQMRQTTVASLLSHRSGIARFSTYEELAPFVDWTDEPARRRERFAHRMLAAPPAAVPGEWLYSNAGYTVAAAMAERVTGQPWEELFRGGLLTPLGMHSAGFGWPAHVNAAAPVGHINVAGSFEIHEQEMGTPPQPLLAAAGDMHMTVADLATFARAYLNGLAGTDAALPANVFGSLHHAFELDPTTVPQIVFAGSAGTFYALLSIRPAQQRATVLMANAGDNDGSMLDRLVDTLTERIPVA